MLMILLAGLAVFQAVRGHLPQSQWLLRWLPAALLLPYVGNTTGWMLTEFGRQPWIVFGVMKTEAAVSPTVSAGAVLTTLLLFTALYGVLMAVDIKLLSKYAQAGPLKEREAPSPLQY